MRIDRLASNPDRSQLIYFIGLERQDLRDLRSRTMHHPLVIDLRDMSGSNSIMLIGTYPPGTPDPPKITLAFSVAAIPGKPRPWVYGLHMDSQEVRCLANGDPIAGVFAESVVLPSPYCAPEPAVYIVYYLPYYESMQIARGQDMCEFIMERLSERKDELDALDAEEAAEEEIEFHLFTPAEEIPHAIDPVLAEHSCARVH